MGVRRKRRGSTIGMTDWRRSGAWGMLALAGLSLFACAKSRAPQGEFIPVPSLAHAPKDDAAALEWALVPGATSVVAITPKDVGGISAGELHLDDGSVLKIHPYVLRVQQGAAEQAADPTSVAARVGWWLRLSEGGRTQTWKAEPSPQTPSAGAEKEGVSVLLVESTSPASSSARASGELAGRHVNVRWLATPGAPPAGVFERAVSESAMESVWMRGALAAATGSPLTRWRARLAAGTLVAPPGSAASGGAFGDPVIESLARTIEAQWIAGLSALAGADPALARRVVERLCVCVDAGGGVTVPAWMPEGDGLTVLLDALLDPRPGRCADAARAWLADAPAALCWVVDDAGSVDAASGQPSGMLGVANLSAGPLAAWAERGSGGVPEIVAVPPWSTRRVAALSADAAAGVKRPAGIAADAALRGQHVALRLGDHTFGPTLFSARVPALAPGVVIGPFHPDWRMDDWLTAGADDEYSRRLGPWSQSSLGSADWATTGQVYRGVDAPLATGAARPDRWLLYVEMKQPAPRGAGSDGASATGPELLRVWLGLFGRSTIVLRVLPDGRVIDETASASGAASSSDAPRVARVARIDNGWACWLTIPIDAIEKDGTLRLGVERVDARGVRSSWPRPSLPWQEEPSRIAIDTATWGGVRPPD